MKTYGIISDIHSVDPRLVGAAAKILKDKGANALILNGDLVGERFTGIDEQEYASIVLQLCAQSELEVYAQAGSHEDVLQFEPVIQELPKHYGNLIDVSRNPKITMHDHDLVFLPGSDWHSEGVKGYNFHTEFETGLYRNEDGPIGFTNITDLRKHITQPDKTIVFTHVPKKFSNIEKGVDMAYFAEKEDGSLMPGIALEAMIRQKHDIQDEISIRLKAAQYGFTFKRENRGNQDLADVMDETGITKNITGHFHESVGRAHDLHCNPIPEGTYSNELFWNASYVDGLQVGLLHVNGAQVAYENINLGDYMK